MGASSILLVDDDQQALISLSRTLSNLLNTSKILAVPTAEKALELVSTYAPAVVVSDLSLDSNLGVQSGFNLLKNLLQLDPTMRVIVLTGHGSIEYGLKALSLGAASFLEKPADAQHLAALIKDGMQQAEMRRAYQKLVAEQIDGLEQILVGKSAQIEAVRESVRYAAQTNQAVLLSGETGTGKGVCALAIHKVSTRSAQPFVRYQPNFAGADLVGSDLFGHLKGAFTGANENRQGLVAEADGGTLFLDEVDELPAETQVALLGLLQDKRYRSLGSNLEQTSNFRLICASNTEIRKAVEQGKLRRDLFHRIAHFEIKLPALRERLEDIDLLSQHFLARMREHEAINVLSLNFEALQKLQSYDWPGNVRELQAVVEGAAYRAQFLGCTQIAAQHLQLSAAEQIDSDGSFHAQLQAFKLKIISQALQRNAGNQVKAAKELGLDRSSMRRMLARAL